MAFRRRRSPPEPDRARVEAIIERDVALAAPFDEPTRTRLLDVIDVLLRSKRWEAVGDIELTDDVRVTIAANAAIPILALDPSLYRQVHSIIVRPTSNVTHGTRSGPVAGVIADDPMTVVGQATPNAGPLSIAWDAALAESRRPQRGRNVVIHEFAHKIDMSDGYSDGVPPLRGDAMTRWTDVLADEYEHTGERASDRVLRAYAWTNPAEFFAVTTEAFFCTPAPLRHHKPELYDALRSFYRQDPALTSP